MEFCLVKLEPVGSFLLNTLPGVKVTSLTKESHESCTAAPSTCGPTACPPKWPDTQLWYTRSQISRICSSTRVILSGSPSFRMLFTWRRRSPVSFYTNAQVSFYTRKDENVLCSCIGRYILYVLQLFLYAINQT